LPSYTIEVIDSKAEFAKASITWEELGDNEVKIICPFHKDTSPSFCFNTKKNVGTCKVCNNSADIIGYFIAHFGKAVKRETILGDFKARYDIESVKTFPIERVAMYHKELKEKKPGIIQALYDRGMNDDDIRKHRFGLFQDRITIPVFDSGSRCVNVRQYKPGARKNKYTSFTGYGTPAIYLPEQLKYDTLWLLGGEIKAVVAAKLLNSKGIGAFCVTGGEGAWNGKWNPLIEGKNLFICMDVDPAGVKASRDLGRLLRNKCKSIGIVTLPLSLEKYPKGDINDYIATEKATLEDLLKLMESAEVPSMESKERPEPLSIELSKCELNNGKRVSFDGTPIAADTSPYLIPKEVKLSCTQGQPFCHECSVPNLAPSGIFEEIVEFDDYDTRTLQFVDVTANDEPRILKKVLGIPIRCPEIQAEIEERRPLYDFRVTDNSDNNVGHVAAYLGHKIELNIPHTFIVTPSPSPKDSKLVLLAEKVTPTQDGLDGFELTDDNKKSLEVFQPTEWSKEGIDDKLTEIYDDFESNVTRIYHRRDLHIVCDLVFHSPLYLSFDSRKEPGWLDAIVVGDSAQGKTETATRLSSHYDLGARADCKNATRAGLVGAVKMLGKRWFISWGVIPANDRRLVILEEAKGLRKTEIAQMTDMRSRGVAELTKVETSHANARTRLLWLSNPRKGEMATFAYGVESIIDVAGTPEDVRRFDIGLIVHKDEVNSADIAEFLQSTDKKEHKYTKEVCRLNIMFSWSRKPDQVVITPEVANECIQASVRLSDKFDHTIPLLDHGTARFKLARVAAAVAARTYSVFNDSLVIRKCHVEWAEAFLDRIYSTKYSGYSEWSDIRKKATTLKNAEAIEHWIRSVRYPQSFVEGLLGQETVSRDDLEDWLEVDYLEAAKAASKLVRNRCLQRDNRSYVKNPQFIILLKGLEDLPEENDVVRLYKDVEDNPEM